MYKINLNFCWLIAIFVLICNVLPYKMARQVMNAPIL